MEEEIRAAEARLREAMLAGDVAGLEQLIHDRLRFIGPDGQVYSKQDDLARYRSGVQRMTRIDVEALQLELHAADLAVAVADTALAGEVSGQGFSGRFRYLRVWRREPSGWQIVAGQVGPLGGEARP